MISACEQRATSLFNPIFFRLIDVVSAHGLDLEEARAIVVLPTAMICHASSSVPPTGPDSNSNPPSRKNSVTGQAPRTITCDASRRHKRQIIYASQRNDAYASKPGRYCPHASTDYPRLKLGKTLIDVLKKS